MNKELQTNLIIYKTLEEARLIATDRVIEPNASIPGPKIKANGLCNAKKEGEGCQKGY